MKGCTHPPPWPPVTPQSEWAIGAHSLCSFQISKQAVSLSCASIAPSVFAFDKQFGWCACLCVCYCRQSQAGWLLGHSSPSCSFSLCLLTPASVTQQTHQQHHQRTQIISADQWPDCSRRTILAMVCRFPTLGGQLTTEAHNKAAFSHQQLPTIFCPIFLLSSSASQQIHTLVTRKGLPSSCEARLRLTD